VICSAVADAEIVWSNSEVPLHMSSPVLVGNLLFGLSHRNSGCLFCLDATTGKLCWQTEGRFAQNAALVQAGSVLAVLKSQGELVFIAPSATEYGLLAAYRVSEEATWAHPTLVGNRILVKDLRTLTCWFLEP
jgi:outer membrane protein assembly factor BamB